MFAYCRNNAVCRVDVSGSADQDCVDDSPLDDEDILKYSSGGGGFWDSLVRTMQSAANGLSMAMGNRAVPSVERHHILSNKNSYYTPQYKKIADRYNMSLDDGQNIVSLEGHRGRHTKAYHKFMLERLNDLNAIAMGDSEIFSIGFGYISDFLIANPWLPYAR